jgi:FdhD protein
LNPTKNFLSAIANRSITRIGLGGPVTCEDQLTVEEPIEIAVAWNHRGRRIRRVVSVTMRTPSTAHQSDHDLACGFLFTEGILQSTDQIDVIQSSEESESRQDDSSPEQASRHQASRHQSSRHQSSRHQSSRHQAVTVVFRPGIRIDLCHLKRHFYTTSSCGVCGKTSIDAVTVELTRPLRPVGIPVSSQTIFELPQRLRQHQSVFALTGGLHGCGLFDFEGRLIAHAEDVGRHNAVDKLIGQTLREHSPSESLELFSQSLLVLSGRISFELVQKSLVAGIPMLIAVGAPSSLAVELAQRNGQTLIGFAGGQRYNVYCD